MADAATLLIPPLQASYPSGAPNGSRTMQASILSKLVVNAVPSSFSCCYAGSEVGIQAPDQATVQRCRQQVAWSAESQASLADLECRVDSSADRAASGKVINNHNSIPRRSGSAENVSFTCSAILKPCSCMEGRWLLQ